MIHTHTPFESPIPTPLYTQDPHKHKTPHASSTHRGREERGRRGWERGQREREEDEKPWLHQSDGERMGSVMNTISHTHTHTHT